VFPMVSVSEDISTRTRAPVQPWGSPLTPQSGLCLVHQAASCTKPPPEEGSAQQPQQMASSQAENTPSTAHAPQQLCANHQSTARNPGGTKQNHHYLRQNERAVVAELTTGPAAPSFGTHCLLRIPRLGHPPSQSPLFGSLLSQLPGITPVFYSHCKNRSRQSTIFCAPTAFCSYLPCSTIVLCP
jgi:hypothetical protein